MKGYRVSDELPLISLHSTSWISALGPRCYLTAKDNFTVPGAASGSLAHSLDQFWEQIVAILDSSCDQSRARISYPFGCHFY